MGVSSTYGWDIVFATRVSVLNAALAAIAPEPLHEIREEVHQGGVVVQVDATLGGWQVGSGGSGALLNFTVPCPTLRLSDGKSTQSFSDGTFVVQGTLTFTPPTVDGAGRRTLGLVTGVGACAVLNATFPPPTFASFSVYATAALQAWLDAQTSLPYVLATVEIPAVAPVASLDQVLAPAALSYAYTDTADGGGILGILSTVRGGTASETALLQEVSPDALTGSDTAVLVGSQVLSRLVGGAASAVAFVGAAPSTVSVGGPQEYPVVVGSAS